MAMRILFTWTCEADRAVLIQPIVAEAEAGVLPGQDQGRLKAMRD
jgi:hypothetical protein